MREIKTTTAKTTRNLMVNLTAEERHDYGQRLAELEHAKGQVEHAKGQVEVEKKAAVDGFKNRLSVIAADIGNLVSAIRTGMENRTVDCEWIYTWDAHKKRLVRLDTGELVSEEPIQPGEQQLHLVDRNDEGE